MASLLPNNNYNDDESKGDGGNDVELVHEDSGLLNGNCGDEEEVQNHEASDLTQEQSVSNNADDNNKKARNEISIVDQSIIDKLPNGDAGRHVVYTILTMLDMKSLSSLIYSSFIQLFCKRQKDNTLYQLCKDIQHPYERAYKLQKQKKNTIGGQIKEEI